MSKHTSFKFNIDEYAKNIKKICLINKNCEIDSDMT